MPLCAIIIIGEETITTISKRFLFPSPKAKAGEIAKQMMYKLIKNKFSFFEFIVSI